MNVLIVYAHPEPHSLNHSLKEFAVARLEGNGHAVRVSDLYAIGWKATVDRDDFPANDAARPLDVPAASKAAFEDGTQTRDVAAQQADLLWADAVLLVFPLWWFAMPAILKGWVDRVYAYGFAYGVGEHSEKHWGDRYGEGTFAGKRAMLVVTAGGWEPHYSARGINGPIDDLLFPINHGILHYPGFDVMEPFVLYKVQAMNADRYAQVCHDFGQRLDGLFSDAPIPYRLQNGGDYEIPALTLKHEAAAEPARGFALHRAS